MMRAPHDADPAFVGKHAGNDDKKKLTTTAAPGGGRESILVTKYVAKR